MITYHPNEDIFAADTQAIVNPVNCVGVARKGLALEFKKRFPENHAQYARMCKVESPIPFDVGQLFSVPVYAGINPAYIINFPTKRHWRDASQLQWIVDGLCLLPDCMLQNCVTSIAIPKLGCGLGGLPWPDVRNEIELVFKNKPWVTAKVYGSAAKQTK